MGREFRVRYASTRSFVKSAEAGAGTEFEEQRCRCAIQVEDDVAGVFFAADKSRIDAYRLAEDAKSYDEFLSMSFLLHCSAFGCQPVFLLAAAGLVWLRHLD